MWVSGFEDFVGYGVPDGAVCFPLVIVAGDDEVIVLEFLDGESDLLDGEERYGFVQFLLGGVCPVVSVDVVPSRLFVLQDEVCDFGVYDGGIDTDTFFVCESGGEECSLRVGDFSHISCC